MTSLSDVGPLIAGIVGLLVLLPALVVGVFVIVTVANRADPDPTGRRPLAVYLYAASFVTLLVTMFASYGVVNRLCSLIGKTVSGGVDGGDFSDDSGFSDSSSSFRVFPTSPTAPTVQHPVGDAVSRDVVLFLLIGLVAGLALALHLRAAGRLTADPATRGGPVGRVRSSYVAAVAFVSVLLAVVFAIVALYGVFELISPAIFADSPGGSRARVLRSLLPAAYFVALSLFVLLAHLRATPPDQRPTFRRPRPVVPDQGPYDVGPVPTSFPAPPSSPPPTYGSGAPEVLGAPPRRRPTPRS